MLTLDPDHRGAGSPGELVGRGEDQLVGFTGTTIAAVAKEAGVSAPTVYAGFDSKAALLKRCIDVALAGDAVWVLGAPELYVALTRKRRWSNRQYVGWARNTLIKLVIEPGADGEVPSPPF